MNFFSHYKKRYRIPLLPAAAILVTAACWLSSCKKLIEIKEPPSTMTSTKVFSSDEQAEAAVAGMYSLTINGDGFSNAAVNGFARGLSTMLGSLSSDDILYDAGYANSYYYFNVGRVPTNDAPSTTLWTTAYKSIHSANAILEGITASGSYRLTDSARRLFTGEALLMRAFSHFYLTSFFGDVPLVLTADYSVTAQMTRTPQASIYRQLVEDLTRARELLLTDYTTGNGTRTRPNKWAATALLARVYLYMGENDNAIAMAGEVIEQSSLYTLMPPAQAFLKDSREAIWQLKHATTFYGLGNATPEGSAVIPTPPATGYGAYYISPSLAAAFEDDDARKTNWMGVNTVSGLTRFFPFKYKTGRYNAVTGGESTEFYILLRFAEQYLIRAEALARKGNSYLEDAIKDLNTIRLRSSLDQLPLTLTQAETLEAVAQERRVELFMEWGHRWFDLKRNNKAHDVLSVLEHKQPWEGDYQLLYPIPVTEIKTNVHLGQNPGYN
ncbi:MAG: RagB/SusD family nutrient uptake outer membrane protein [Candidatus Pseudobacter hemicellulosilyticus]|uniref:RagB/SusD family nutrient uptake outer membrane protein n=1 Tax=Candidatus Pseudobacter hemicellulosilyticus TaxID=3121375 RepID=A0AAJ5WQ35_9BACT|nr:MAG: RagB/SusD family nutrient uptake outer membrane protein [Pseudobacter sp.]